MIRNLAILILPLAAACANDPGAECGAAVTHVATCYGDEAAAAFAEGCDAETAAAALADSCATTDEGKADSASTQILSPAVEQFKYGSIGADKLGLPRAILRAIPLVCADTMPAGADPTSPQPLTAFGMIYEPGHELPIGFSQRRLPIIGMTLTGNTCSLCHTATVRSSPSAEPELYFGAPNARFNVEQWSDFLMGCIADPKRFNATNLTRAFNQLGITGIDRFLAYKTTFLRMFTDDLRTKLASVIKDGPWGPGRDDAIGLSAATLLGEQFRTAIPAPIDYPAVWNQEARKGHALHWDGAAGTALERNVLVAVGAGAPRNGVPLASLGAIQNYLEALPAPKYPYPIDNALAARGEPLYRSLCASCHAPDGARVFTVIPNREVGTDPNRLDVITQAGVDELNSMSGTGWQFDNFRKTDGYLAGLLDGIWLRAPYLHNGSVPTLRDLLKPAAERPTSFFRGYDVYDPTNVGYVSTVASEGATGYMHFDTSRTGNTNVGHEYGTNLSPADQDALLEYLKTL